MVSIDIACDLMDEDATGFVWTFLRDAREPGLIEPGAIVVAGHQEAPARRRGRRHSQEAGRPGRAPSPASRSDRGLRGARSTGHHATGVVILDVVDGRIRYVEVLYRDDVKSVISALTEQPTEAGTTSRRGRRRKLR